MEEGAPDPMWQIAKGTFREWSEDRVSMLAAALAYYTVFSLAPLLVIVVGVLSLLGQGGARQTIVDRVSQEIGPDVAGLVNTMIVNTQEAGGSWWATIIAVGIVVVGATGVMAQLSNALNIIWKVEADPEVSGVMNVLRKRVQGLLLILALAPLVLASVLASAMVGRIAAFFEDMGLGSNAVWTAVDWVVSLMLLTLIFAVLFKVLPDVRISWRSVWVGAALTAVLFVIGKTLLGFYLSVASVASAYGAAGSLVVLLLWVFYSAQVLLLGAEFTQVYAKHYGHGIRPAPHAVPADR